MQIYRWVPVFLDELKLTSSAYLCSPTLHSVCDELLFFVHNRHFLGIVAPGTSDLPASPGKSLKKCRSINSSGSAPVSSSQVIWVIERAILPHMVGERGSEFARCSSSRHVSVNDRLLDMQASRLPQARQTCHFSVE